MIQTSAASISEEMYEENDRNMMIKKLVANTSKIKKKMKYIAHSFGSEVPSHSKYFKILSCRNNLR